MKSPWDVITDLAADHAKQAKENLKENFKLLDGFMTWIVGFSIAGVTLIVANTGKSGNTFSHKNLKTALVLLTISIVAGIIYRLVFYFYQTQHQQIQFKIYGAFLKEEFAPMQPDDVSNESDVKEVLWLLKSDYDEDLSSELERYKASNEINKKAILQSLKDHYLSLGKHIQAEYEFSMKYVADTYKEAYNLSDKQVMKIMQPTRPKIFKTLGWIVSLTFTISCLSFLAVLIMLVCKY